MKVLNNVFGVVLLLATIFNVENSVAQYSPTNYIPITIDENNGTDLTNYQVHFIVNTQALVGLGLLEADGRDIRFGSSICLTDTLPHWIESGMNTASTEIWVTVPQLDANSQTTIYLFTGDPNATDISDFVSVFPNAIITAGSNVNVVGAINPGWLQVDANDTLFVTQGMLLDIHSRRSIIEGVIMADGSGYSGGINGPLAGSGPGAGGTSGDSGSGGGSYGGTGGTGGYDNNDTPGAGGSIYGSVTGNDIDMGSGGGASLSVDGGNGGGGILLYSEFIIMNGTITANGEDGENPGGGQGGGGGSGGGVLLHGEDVTFGGTITTNGGDGSVGTISANDDGGGGAGGRIKIFYGTSSITGTTEVTPGVGGPNGSFSATDGTIGTSYIDNLAFNPVTYILGTPLVPQTVVLSEADTTICEFDDLSFTVTGTGPYDFEVNGVNVQSGISNVYLANGLTNGDIVTIINGSGCVLNYPVTVTSNPIPTITGSLSGCEGDTISLSATSGFVSYLWSNAGINDTIEVFTTGQVMVEVTDSIGCIGTDTVDVVFNANPIPTISYSAGTLTADAGYLTYQWQLDGTDIMGETNQILSSAGTGSYTVIVTNVNGCSGISAPYDATAGLEDHQGLTIGISPNPFNDLITIQLNSLSKQSIELEVIDGMGRKIFAESNNINEGQNAIALNLSSIPSGIYYVTIEIQERTFTHKVIKK